MKASDLDYHLPRNHIAQEPSGRREDSRLMLVERAAGRLSHHHFRDLPRLLGPGDCLVLNDSRVMACRLFGRRAGTGGRVELLLLETKGRGRRRALVNPYRRFCPGEVLLLPARARAYCLQQLGEGYSLVDLRHTGPLRAYLERYGRMPLPPYIKRKPSEPSRREDRDRYQTVFARVYGSAAAPTAGLHFSRRLITRLGRAGVGVARGTLHVGPGTFRSEMRGELADNSIEGERFSLGAKAAGAVNRAGRVIAVGTTVCRVLESQVDGRGRIIAGRGVTDLFIRPGHDFRAVDALITNFHLPRSSLLALVCAFAGRDLVMRAYEEAKRRGYRFYSYGDAMLII